MASANMGFTRARTRSQRFNPVPPTGATASWRTMRLRQGRVPLPPLRQPQGAAG